ncbi:MAG: NAD(P)H-binding protein [Armatimonadetes bacterium]|nr:NAD(P)H-binding protein [Armatimonadota bacterium]
MKVFVIGGTGFLGTHLLPKLLADGHDVTTLTRHKEKASGLEDLGVKVIVGDLLQPERWLSSLTPQDAVVAIAMPDIKIGRISTKRFRAIRDRATTYFTSAVSAAEKCGCPLIMTQGTALKTDGDEVADETWPFEPFGFARMAENVLPLLSKVIERGSPPIIRMLPGQIYGNGGLFKRLMYDWMKKGRYRIIGSGDNYFPRIHVDDCAQAYVQTLAKMPLGETFILADDAACTEREFANQMADCMNVRRPKSVPAFIVRLAAGRIIHETVTMNCRVTNARAKESLGWTLTYPTYRQGLPAAVKQIESDVPHVRAD